MKINIVSPLKKIKLLFIPIIIIFSCLPAQTNTTPEIANTIKPYKILVDYSIPYSDVYMAKYWIEHQVGQTLFLISDERPTRNFIDDIVLVPGAATISSAHLNDALAGQTTITTNQRTRSVVGAQIEINQKLFSNHEWFTITLRHEMLHLYDLHDRHCVTFEQMKDIMCNDSPFNLNAIIIPKDIEKIRNE